MLLVYRCHIHVLKFHYVHQWMLSLGKETSLPQRGEQIFRWKRYPHLLSQVRQTVVALVSISVENKKYYYDCAQCNPNTD